MELLLKTFPKRHRAPACRQVSKYSQVDLDVHDEQDGLGKIRKKGTKKYPLDAPSVCVCTLILTLRKKVN